MEAEAGVINGKKLKTEAKVFYEEEEVGKKFTASSISVDNNASINY